jgi:hypothetical protein
MWHPYYLADYKSFEFMLYMNFRYLGNNQVNEFMKKFTKEQEAIARHWQQNHINSGVLGPGE